MKIKLDENMPFDLAPLLKQLGHDVDTSPEEGLTGAIDEDVWDAAQSEGRFLITQDLDFSDVRKFTPGTHQGILLLRLHSPLRTTLIRHVYTLFQTENVDSWTGCFIVASERKVRIRRPPQN
ncbi:MAG: DUF5615 family PIN-like protein [Chloroflexi bacterium]|nr:DUF5615 family PIN-like protein [Chloroflexota bacterium]MBP8058447.1 DUF5615 family PIN-like protein [Chloroflexota bacterium]